MDVNLSKYSIWNCSVEERKKRLKKLKEFFKRVK